MQQLVQLTESLREFVAQPNYPTLVVVGTDAGIVFPHRILAALDRQDDETYFLLFPYACATADQYLGHVLQSLRTQLEIFSKELAARSRPALPPLPLEVEDGRQPGARRLEALVRHVGEVAPSNSPIVWALMPSELVDVAGYRALIEPLLALHDVPAWMDRHRFLVRDRREAPTIAPELHRAGNDRVLVLDLDLDQARLTSGLAEAAADTALPGDQRALALLQLGAVDMALGRYPEALEKHGVAFNYYERSGDRPMQSLCLINAGDTLYQSGQAELALERYQQSLALSVEERNAPLIRPGVHGAGLSCLNLGRNEEAEGYFEHSNQLAGKLNDPFAKSDALEQLGLARYRQGKLKEAVETWLAGKGLALTFGYEQRAAHILDRLAEACDEQGASDEASAFRSERSQLDATPSGSGKHPE